MIKRLWSNKATGCAVSTMISVASTGDRISMYQSHVHVLDKVGSKINPRDCQADCARATSSKVPISKWIRHRSTVPLHLKNQRICLKSFILIKVPNEKKKREKRKSTVDRHQKAIGSSTRSSKLRASCTFATILGTATEVPKYFRVLPETVLRTSKYKKKDRSNRPTR